MAYKDSTVDAVWDKARVVEGRNPVQWRQDQCGAWLHRDQYGARGTEYGWKIENVSGGGPDLLENLQPFHRDNSYDIENGEPRCRVTADREDIPAGQQTGQPRNNGVTEPARRQG